MGLADEAHNMGSEIIIQPWCKNLFTALDLDFQPIDLKNMQFTKTLQDKSKYFETGTITEFKRITSESHWQDTRFVKIKLPSQIDATKIHTCFIMPENTDEKSQRFCDLFNDNSLFQLAKTKLDLRNDFHKLDMFICSNENRDYNTT